LCSNYSGIDLAGKMFYKVRTRFVKFDINKLLKLMRVFQVACSIDNVFKVVIRFMEFLKFLNLIVFNLRNIERKEWFLVHLVLFNLISIEPVLKTVCQY